MNIAAISPLVHSRPAVCGTQQSRLIGRLSCPKGNRVATDIPYQFRTQSPIHAPLSPPSRVARPKGGAGRRPQDQPSVSEGTPEGGCWVRGEGGVLKRKERSDVNMKHAVHRPYIKEDRLLLANYLWAIHLWANIFEAVKGE